MVAESDEASDINSHDDGHDITLQLSPEDMLSPLSQHTGTGNQKQALMKMIAQEMVQAFVDPNQEGENDEALQRKFDNTIKQQRNLRKAKREEKPNSQHSESRPGIPSGSGYDLALEDVDFANETTENRRNRLKAQRWASLEGSECLPEPELRKVTDSPVKPMREKSTSRRGSDFADSVRADSTNTTSVVEDELSIEEIRRFVLENIPRTVRDQIPEEAWGKIFGGVSSRSSGVSRRSLEQASASASESEKNQQDSLELEIGPQDDISMISGLTSAFPDGKSLESKMMSLCSLDMDREDKIEETSESFTVEEPEDSSNHSLERSSRINIAESKERTSKGVAFGTVEVRYYERTGADNPAVTSGAAVGIGWKYKRGARRTLDQWESQRGTPLKSFELVMDRAEREHILKKAGYTQKEIAQVVRTCLKGRNQRQQTVSNLQHAGMEEAVEAAQSRIAKIMRFGKKKSLIK
ncbi:unnamed protein product [Cylindrotheca closterium]|uniref:Uncharacterized protein n=1 Tax=Cylindrotheca closterium TaxID=2856 RepID=A0AAD2C9Z1_9STRA|nr:unnamed protein product [Cylindrotheca closterium]